MNSHLEAQKEIWNQLHFYVIDNKQINNATNWLPNNPFIYGQLPRHM